MACGKREEGSLDITATQWKFRTVMHQRKKADKEQSLVALIEGRKRLLDAKPPTLP